MARNSFDLEDLGDAIETIIDQAVSSQNYQKLNQTIRQAVNAAVDSGSDALRRVVEENAKRNKPPVVEQRKDPPVRPRVAYAQPRQTHYQPNKNIYSSHLGSSGTVRRESNLPVLYRNTSGKLAGGIVKTVGGGIMTLFSTGGLLATGLVSAVVGGGGLMAIPGILSTAALGGGVWLLSSGIRTIGMVQRFDKYVKAMGGKTYCDLQKLARAVGKPQKFVRKELKGMIDSGLFLEGHMDEEETSLITSDDTFVHYLETQQRKAVQKQQEVVETIKKQKEDEAKKVSAQVQEVLDKGNAFIREIRRCNDAIPGEIISGKISRIETIVQMIFTRAEAHPEIVPDLKKLMDYYLPMTVKLLNAYAEMDAQPIQGENIQNAKREIEATLDTLNTAFEKLLDSIFKETALDISSDISVLQTILAQEGLTEDEFSKLRNTNK